VLIELNSCVLFHALSSQILSPGIHGNGIAEMLEAIVPVLYDVTEDTIEAEEVQGARTVSGEENDDDDDESVFAA